MNDLYIKDFVQTVERMTYQHNGLQETRQAETIDGQWETFFNFNKAKMEILHVENGQVKIYQRSQGFMFHDQGSQYYVTMKSGR